MGYLITSARLSISGYVILTSRVSWTQPHILHMSIAELLTQVVT